MKYNKIIKHRFISLDPIALNIIFAIVVVYTIHGVIIIYESLFSVTVLSLFMI